METGSAGAQRWVNRLLIAGALAALVIGLAFQVAGDPLSRLVWTAGTLPVVVALAMVLAAFGFLSPLQGALVQEAIDVAVILNALRALVAPAQA